MTFENFLTLLRVAGNAVYDALFWPGYQLLVQISNLSPQFASNLSAQGNDTVAVFIASLSYWFLAIVLLVMLRRLYREFAIFITALLSAIAFRISHKVGSAKTKLVCLVRKRLSWDKPRPGNEESMVEFDRLDLAIMKSAFTKGPGFAMSAPELAEQFSLRPSQIQRSLDKLRENSMVSVVIGSTDGFDNYRLTKSGATFIAMLKRRQPHTAIPQITGA